MIFKKKHGCFFLLFSILLCNISVFAMKRQFPNDNELTTEKKDLKNTIFLPIISISMKSTEPYFDLMLIMHYHLSSLYIPKYLINKILSTTIEPHNTVDMPKEITLAKQNELNQFTKRYGFFDRRYFDWPDSNCNNDSWDAYDWAV